MRKAVLASLVFLALSATACMAQTQGRHPFFDRLDTDKDGTLSKAEVRKQFPNFTDEMFKQADTNGDGKLSVAEWQAFAKAKRAERKAATGSN